MCNAEALRKPAGYPHTNELNVAAVCAGYAFELIYKVLVKVGGKEPKATHLPSDAHKKLAEQDRIEVERIINSHGWKDKDEFLTYLNEQLCDKDRKYWMISPKGEGPARGEFHFGGRKGIDALKRLHEDISTFTMKRINAVCDEDWPGTERPE